MEAATTEPRRIDPAAGRLEREAARARASTLFVEHGELVRRVCVGLLRDRHDAEDASQQTFLSAYRALVEGTEPREPAAWLATIARNECLLRIRARMRAPIAAPLEEEPALDDVHRDAVARSHAARLWREIGSLPRQQRDAVILREFAGLSYEELAVALGISKPAVESLLFRARGRLRSRLEAAVASVNLAGIASSVADAAARLVGSGAAQPAAAKIVAAGAAAALVGGGGAVVADHVVPSAPEAAVRKPPAHVARRAPASSPVFTIASAPATTAMRPAPRPQLAAVVAPGRDAHGHEDGGGSVRLRDEGRSRPDNGPDATTESRDGGGERTTATDRTGEDGTRTTAESRSGSGGDGERSGGDGGDSTTAAPAVSPAQTTSSDGGRATPVTTIPLDTSTSTATTSTTTSTTTPSTSDGAQAATTTLSADGSGGGDAGAD